MTATRRAWPGLVAGVVVFLADQASKSWVLHGLDLPRLGSVAVLPMLSFTLVWNQGITFGLLQAGGGVGSVVLAAVALAVVVGLGLWLRRAETRLVATAIGAIGGGALGNVADRFRYGAVVDFIHAHAGGHSFYVFNLGDAAICCGVAALLLDGARSRGDEPGLRPPAPPG